MKKSTRQCIGTNDPNNEFSLENFSVTDYISRQYAETSHEELVNGLEKLRKGNTSKAEQLKTLVAEHFDKFVECREAIDIVQSVVDGKTTKLDSVEKIVEEMSKSSDLRFKPVINRINEQRSIKNALIVLNRFRSTFEAPGRIEEFRNNKDYERVVDEYIALCQQHPNTKSKIIKIVLDSAKGILQETSKELVAKLEDPKSNAFEKERAKTLLKKIQKRK